MEVVTSFQHMWNAETFGGEYKILQSRVKIKNPRSVDITQFLGFL